MGQVQVTWMSVWPMSVRARLDSGKERGGSGGRLRKNGNPNAINTEPQRALLSTRSSRYILIHLSCSSIITTNTIAGKLSSIIYTTSILVDIIEQAKILVLRRGETKEIHLVNR